MRFEALEFLVRRKIGVLIVEVNNETYGNEIIAIMIEE